MYARKENFFSLIAMKYLRNLTRFGPEKASKKKRRTNSYNFRVLNQIIREYFDE